jgi:PAS domain S-box-containing protein
MPVWSDNFYRLCGVERGDFDGTFDSFLQRFVHPDDRNHLWQAFLDFADGSGPDWVEFRHVRSDGAIRDFHAHVQMARRENGQLVRCYGTTTDITERKEAERKLKEEEQRYRLLADHSSDVIARVCDDGKLAYVSPACRKILGYEPEELLGRTLMDLVSPDDQPLCREAMDRLLNGEEHASVPFRGQRKNGSVVWLENNSKLLVDESGRRELLCVIRDITERRTLEEQIAQAQRLEAIGRLAGGIAHDFNNILTVINGYAEVLEMQFSGDEQASKFVANILEAGRRASQLTRQLLTYSRKQLLSRGMVNLNTVIRTLEPLLMPLIGEEIELSFRLEPTIGLIEGDAGQLEQLIMNLAVNARDAMPAGGRLTLETNSVLFSPSEVRPHRLPPGPFVKLVVSDTGQGMDDNVKAHLFEPFFTTKEIGRGTGLGLATVYATMEQCGGAIAVESALGAGSRFELYFPAQFTAASPEAVTLTFRESAESSNGHRRILVVEDDDPVRSLVELTLRKASYSVRTAASGEDAMKLIDADPRSFDLLLTDVVMKGVNGRELADALRQRAPHLAVIFMSGHTEDAVVRSGVLNDQLTFLQKPFTADELMDRVQQVLARQAV